MRKSNRVLAALLSILMIISMLPVFAGAAAYGFSDFPTGTWSEEAVTAAVNNGLLQGKGGGIIAPRDNLTRAEAAAVINRAFGATVKADISEYTDVNPGDWYYSEFQKAVNMGTIVGEGDGILNPNGYITREAMFTMVARALVLSDTTAGSLSRFVDGSDTSVWAASYVSAMAKRGYVNGDNDGRLNPQAYITREEFAQVMHNIFKMYISTSGTVSDAVYGTTIIRVPNVDLKNITINGDLILGDGVGAGDVYMTNVKVTGRILCRGGEGTVDILSGCTVGEMVVIHDVNGVVNFHNYSNEKIFEGIVLNTEATFLGNVSFNTGSSSSSSKKNASYTIYIYEEDVDKEGEYKLLAPTKSETAKKGIKITYTPDDKYGFIVDEAKSVLSGTNNGSLEIKVYYKRLKYNVTIDGVLGVPYEYRYGQTIDKNEDLAKIIMEKKIPAVEPGYEIEGYYTEENGKGTKVDSSYVVLGPVTIYPNIVPEMFDVIYKANGGKIKVNKELLDEVTEENKVTVTGTYDLTDYELEYAGHTFMGWYMEGKPNEIITTIPTGMTDDVTVYAKWVENANFTFKVASTTDTEVRVNVILDKMPEDIENGIKNIVINYTRTGAGAAQLVYNSVIPGITGSTDGSADGIIKWTGDAFTALPTDGVLFTLVFTKDKFATGEVTFTYGDITLTNDTESSTAFNIAPLTFDIGTGKTKITVKYKNADYSVYEDEKLYDALNGTVKLSDALASFDKDEVPAGFTHQGFKFDGENGLITPDTIAKSVMDGKVIVPNFVAIKYDIIYDVNTNDTSAKINGVPVLTLNDVYDIDTYKGTNLYKLHDLTTATIVRDGYTFVGWHLKDDLSDAAITHIPNKLLPEGNATGITVYAEWEQNAVLGLYTNAATDKENLVIDVILNKLPVGTTGITSVTFEYDLTATDANAGIVYKSISSTVGTVVRNGNKITWTGDISSISNAGVTLFTITFSKNREATGNVTIDFVDDKATILDAAGKEVTYGYDVKGITTTVNGDQLFEIKFDGKTYQTYATEKLSTAAIDLDAAVKELLVDALNAYKPEEHYEFKNGKKFIINGAEYTIDQIKEIAVNGDITITSAETPIEYTVKYMDGSSDAAFDATVTVDYSYNIDEPISSLPTPASKADEGLKFASWHTDASLSDASKVNSVDINSPRDNNNVTTLYAKWDAIEYKLIYVLNGGKVGATTGEYEVTLDVDTLGGKKYTLINENDVEWADPQNPKYFKGWYKDAALTTPIDKIDDITKLDPENPMYVYADWSGESVLSLSYKPVTVEKDTTEIMVYVELSDFPKDIGIDDLSAITIDYIMEGNSEGILTYKGVEYVRVDGAGKPLGTTNGTFKNNADGRIVWNANSSADRLTEIDNNKAIFVITFAREDLTKGGKVKVKIDGAELANYNAKIATGYTIDPNGIVIDIPDGYYTVHYNGTDYDVAENAKLDTNTNLINAINAKLNTQNTDGYEWVVYADGASGKNEIDVTTYEVKEDITITIVEEPIPYTITYYIYNDDTKAFEQYGNVDDYNVKDMVNSTYDLLAPTKSGFTFIGWYDKETFTDSDAKINAITKLGNYKFYGKWIEQVGTINYYAHAIDESSKTVKIDVKINELPEKMEDISVLRLYYDLEDADGELEYVKTELNPGLGLSGNFEHKLGAMTWAASGMTIMPMSEGRAAITAMADGVITKELLEANNNVVATITFNVNMKDDDWDGSVHATIKTSDNQIHMKDSDGKEPDSYVGSSATVLKAAKPFTITYELGTNGKFDGESPKTTYTIEDTDYDLTAFKPVREGYVFEYWYEGTTDKKVTTIPASEWLEKDAKVYTAKWRKENPVLTFVKLSSTDTEVKVGVTLEDIPNDVDNLKSIELTYDMDVDLLKYKDTALYDGIPGTITEKADGTIKWTTDKALTSEDMMTLGNILFEITFTKDLATEGDVTFSYTNTKLTDSNGADATMYEPKDGIISITKADSIVVKVHRGMNFVADIPVEVGGNVTQAKLDAVINPATYSVEEGYTDSDGNVHEIMPEYWYQDGKEWKLFDVNMPIMKETNVYLMTRYAMLTYQTDFEIKGYSPKIELSVAYDSNTEIIKSGLDALTSFGRVLDGMLDDVEMVTGIDPYEKALEKAAKTGLVDSDGNLLNPLVAIPLHRIITESTINDELDSYIETHKEDDDFIAKLISNDHVEAALLASKDLRNRLLTNTKSKDIIKDYIRDNKDDATLKADIQKALKSKLKADTVKMLEDSTIKQGLIDAVETYLNNNSITKITATDVVDKIIDGTLEGYDAELYENVMTEYDRVFNEKYDNYFNSNYDQLMTEHFDSYFDDTVDAYVNDEEMDEALRTYITNKLVWYEQKLINEFIDGTDRTLLHDAIVDYEDIAIATIKTTNEYNQPIDDFVSGNGVRVNEGNIVFIEILDELMHTYDYDKLAADFLPENVQKVVDLVGHDIVADIVDAYFAEFCKLMDDAIAKFNADYDAGITDAEYTFSTRPAVRIHYMEIVEIYYNKVMAKVKPKLNSKQFIANNPYVQRLLAKDWILEFLDYDASKVSEEMSGYSIKKGHYDDVMETYGSPIVRYYDILLENVILVHDAVMWYNTLGEASLEDKLDAVSQILGVYANKANNVIMHYIETGELPKGYTPYELADKFLGKVLGVNDKVDSAYDKAEDFYLAHEDKILEYIDKAKNFYEDYLDRDYTEIIDLANLSVYADGNAYEVYKILLEMSEENNAFNIDTLATAIFDSTNYHGVNKIEDVMMKIKAKLDGKNKAEEIQKEEGNEKLYIRDAYRATLNSREIKGYNTGTHTVTAQRHLRYIIR